jgi:hypothetical protein
MKYPKPGYHNPLVSVHVFDLGRYLEKVADLGGEEEVPAEEETHTLDWDGRRGVKDSVILEVACVGNGSLVVKYPYVPHFGQLGSDGWYSVRRCEAGIGVRPLLLSIPPLADNAKKGITSQQTHPQSNGSFTPSLYPPCCPPPPKMKMKKTKW